MEIPLHTGEHCSDKEQTSGSNVDYLLLDDSEVTAFSRCYSFDIKVTNSLLESLEKCKIPNNFKLGEKIDYLYAWIGFPEQTENDPLTGYMLVYRSAELLTQIFSENPPPILNLRFDIGPLNEPVTGIALTPTISSQFYITEFGSDVEYANKIEFNSPVSSRRTIHAWKKYRNWDTTISVSAIYSKFPETSSIGWSFGHKMLHEQLFCDATIVLNPNTEIKCHRSVLAAHSPVLEAMFQTKMKEGNTGTLDIVDMSEESVRALLEYLYTKSTNAPEMNSQICLELLQAGRKYLISCLEKMMERILLLKWSEWYTAEVALLLFLFARKTGQEILRQKALRVMKSKYKELEELPAYQKLLKENIEAVKELIKFFACVKVGSSK